MSEGIQFALKNCEYDTRNHNFSDYLNNNEQPCSRPIKRLYINFDKDIAHKMFGYRVRFLPENMK